MLMDHLEDIKDIPTIMNMWTETAIKPLTTRLPDTPYTEDDILHAVGVLQTNTVRNYAKTFLI